jgi:hypothetical protein
VLKQSASAPLLIIDVLVDSLVAYGEGSVNLEIVGDLLGAQVLFQQTDDVYPKLGGEVKAASLALPPGRCIAVGYVGTIEAIGDLSVALKFPTDCTGRTLELSGNLGV